MTMTTANGVIAQQMLNRTTQKKIFFPNRAATTKVAPARLRRADDGERRGNNDPRQNKQPRQNNQPRRDKRDVHGWVVLDKPIGMTSTHAVAVLKRLFQAKRAGHAGTLDPLGVRRPADRARRSHQDGSLRDGRPQALPLHGRLGRGARHRRYRGPGDPDQRAPAVGRRGPGPAAAVHRPDRADPAAIFGDQGPGRTRL